MTEFFENSAPEKEVQTERNLFGYLVNILLATFWLSVFVYIYIDAGWRIENFLGNGRLLLLKGYQWDYFKLADKLEQQPVPFFILGFAGLILGSFHAYALHSESYAKDKKDSDSLMTRISKNWPLIIGTILLVTAVSMIYNVYNNVDMKFSYQNIVLFLISIIVPVMICLALLYSEIFSNLFSPWTVKADGIEETEVAYEFRVVGFLVYIALALIWFGFSACLAYVICFGNIEEMFRVLTVVLFTICCIINGFVLLYNLCTPKYDSGESYFKNNWVIISSCTTLSMAFIVFAIFKWIVDEDCRCFTIVTPIVILLSILSCVILIPSNNSQSCIGCFKPWNIVKKTEKDNSV